jgi:large subunit ribosomal protein L19
MSATLNLPAEITPEQVRTGMTIRVHQKIKDVSAQGKEKERVQIFEGIVLKVGGTGLGKTMTVRKIASGVGVEKIFPLTLPSIEKIECVKQAKVTRKHIGFVRDSKKRLKESAVIKVRGEVKEPVKENKEEKEPEPAIES